GDPTMAIAVSYPGVYVREEASGARAIGGVATSVACFVGMADKGPMDTPTRVFVMADFERQYGTTSAGEMADQVRQFYLNGGGEAWIMRIADGDVPAEVTLRDHADTDIALVVTARDAGILGDQIRLEVDYNTARPEETFNLRVFRSTLLPDGRRSREAEEAYTGLSMRPGAPTFAETAINGASQLITVDAPTVPASNRGVSIGGRVLAAAAGDALSELQGLVTTGANALRLQVANHPAVLVNLTAASSAGADLAAVAATWQADMNEALTNATIGDQVEVLISGDDVASGGIDGGRLLRITSDAGAVRITAAPSGDVSVALGLGVAAGGIEGSAHADLRPAPNGLVARMGTSADDFAGLRTFAGLVGNTITPFAVTDSTPDSPHGAALALGATPLFDDGSSRHLNNVRDALDTIAGVITANTSGRWTAARHGVRLALTPTDTTANAGAGATLTLTGAAIDAVGNVRAYTVGEPGGTAGTGPFQVSAVAGIEGSAPQPTDYGQAYAVIDREIPLFNLLILPRAHGQDDDARQALWGAASAFCARKRAFLLVDPREDWGDIRAAELGVDAIRIGVETRNAACYWPRVRVADGTRQGKAIDPAGSIAGLMARTDSTRGVWKAPAGLEATIRGVIGLERRITDDENGVINPKALNALRVFSAGVVSWGARTLVGFNDSGNIDDKYVPVRRTMLFIEESLYRGLQFAVFEPNDEPLWAQIRLAAGSFMNGLFRQGAFAGSKASDAYFVACDATTTTASDINLGIVNVVVGFAPLKPAEFVILTVKQMAGQAEV
ncbi:MAG: phage tail sheath family protein, partial [Pseudomonadota bacterium]